MKRFGMTFAVIALVAALGSAGSGKPKPSVEYAQTWEQAVEEAKMLNLPIVVHSHGFY